VTLLAIITEERRRRARRTAAAAAAAVLLSAGFAAPATAQTVSDETHEVVVGFGKSRVVELPLPYTDVMVADPKIADVAPLNTHAISIVGNTLGATSISLYGPGKRLLAALNVEVSADIETFKTRLHDLLPEETEVSARPAGQSLVLSGTVSSPASLHQVLTLAEAFAPGHVVNMMGVEGTQQIMLSVRFVEMERTVAKDLKLNVQSNLGTNPAVAIATGQSVLGNVQNSFGTILANYQWAGQDLSVLFDALEQKGLIKTLAEPTLVANSGDTASFLAGGEYPIPVASTSSGGVPSITIDFKQFGVALAFTPTLLKDGLIDLVVNPEVSSIDPTTSINTGVISVPGLKVRRAHTTVELRDGESFTIAGMLQGTYQNEVDQFPFLGDVPVLGALFRSTSFQRDETELVIVVTPHLAVPRRDKTATPADHFVPPSDLELFLFGSQVGASANLRPEDRALLALDPGKAGIDGPHGHVVY
jgi:pilus assembly protein CpaC